jgi:hypothetical protein
VHATPHFNGYLLHLRIPGGIHFHLTLRRIHPQFWPVWSEFRLPAVHTFFNGKLKIRLRGSEDEIIVSKERAAVFKKWLDK